MQLVPKLVGSRSAEDIQELLALNERLRRFYARVDSARYWDIAESFNAEWTPASHPAHYALKGLIGEKEIIADFGCGSAHPARNLGHPERYIGIDWGSRQIDINRTVFPQARFLNESLYETSLGTSSCDWAMSMFVLEHCVWPQRVLKEMVRVIRPGGSVAVICPQMRPHVMNSMWAGTSAHISLKRKLRKLALFDAAIHFLGLRVLTPIWLHTASKRRIPFPILLRPRCLYSGLKEWSSDTDAVYWADHEEISRELVRLGCTLRDIHTSTRMTGVVFVLARKQ